MGLEIETKVEPIDRDVEVILKEDLSPSARSAALAAFARDQLAEAEQENKAALGRVPVHHTYVDGTPSENIDRVQPDGEILYEFDLIEDLLAWIGDQIEMHSPVKSGRYERGHRLFADGALVEPGADIPQADEYVFLNITPYARKIERGESPMAPEGVYEAVATLARARFSNQAAIKFTYRAFAGGGMLDYVAAAGGASRKRKNAAAIEREYRTPAIVVTLR